MLINLPMHKKSNLWKLQAGTWKFIWQNDKFLLESFRHSNINVSWKNNCHHFLILIIPAFKRKGSETQLRQIISSLQLAAQYSSPCGCCKWRCHKLQGFPSYHSTMTPEPWIFHPISFGFHTQQSKDVAKSIHICISLQIRLQPGSRGSTTATRVNWPRRRGWCCEAWWSPDSRLWKIMVTYSSEKISSNNFFSGISVCPISLNMMRYSIQKSANSSGS